MNNLFEPSSTLSVQENQVRGMSNTTYSKFVETRSSRRVDHVGIERAHLRRPVRRGDHGKTGGVIRQHDLEQLPVESVRPRLDFRQIETRLDDRDSRHRAVLEIEIHQAG